jgi:hypothetical protein
VGQCIKVLVGKPEGKRPIGKLNGRWNDNIFYWKNTVEGVVCIYLPKIGTSCGLICSINFERFVI